MNTIGVHFGDHLIIIVCVTSETGHNTNQEGAWTGIQGEPKNGDRSLGGVHSSPQPILIEVKHLLCLPH